MFESLRIVLDRSKGPVRAGWRAEFLAVAWMAAVALGFRPAAEAAPEPRPTLTARPEMVLEIAEVGGDIVFSPDGKTMGVLRQTGVSEASVEVWDVGAHRLKRIVRGPDIYEAPRFTADSRALLVRSGQNTLLSDVASGQTHSLFGKPLNKLDVMYRDGSNGRLIAFYQKGVVQIFNVRSGKRLSSFAFKTDEVEFIFSPDGKRLAVASNNHVQVRDVSTGKRICVTHQPTRSGMDAMAPVVFAPDGRTFATAGVDPKWAVPGGDWGDTGYTIDYVAKIWDARTGKMLRMLEGWSSGTTPYVPLAFSPDGQNLVCGAETQKSVYHLGGEGGRAEVWNVHSGEKLLEAAYSCDPALSSDHTLLALFGGGNRVQVYDTSRAKLLRSFAWDSDTSPIALAIAPDKRSIVTEGEGFSLSWWDWRRGVKTFAVTQGFRTRTPTSVAFSPDGSLVRSRYGSGSEGKVYEWDARGGGLRRVAVEKVAPTTDSKRVPLFGKRNEYEVLSPDGTRAIVATNNGGGKDEFLSAWDVASKQLIWKQKIEGKTPVYEAFVSPDGKTLATFHYLRKPSSLALRSMETGELLHTLDASNYVDRITFSADGQSIAAEDPAIPALCVWDVKTGKRRATLKEESNYPVSIALSPNGKRLVRLGTEGDVILYDVESGKVLLTWIALAFPEGSEPQWIATTPEGYYAASKSAEQYIRWRVGSQILPLQKYRSALFRPGLVEQRLQGE